MFASMDRFPVHHRGLENRTPSAGYDGVSWAAGWRGRRPWVGGLRGGRLEDDHRPARRGRPEARKRRRAAPTPGKSADGRRIQGGCPPALVLGSARRS